ncbi:MAG: hypothetical protein KJ811_01075 [Candidatus Margulisbacteria bacterium]|nr:hypothetical protein [Candidatus Margulisiibacteriota bacterium]
MKERDKMQILLEDIRSKVQLIAEGHSVLQAQNNRLETSVEQIKGDVKRIDRKTDQMQGTLYALNDKLNEHLKQPSHTV